MQEALPVFLTLSILSQVQGADALAFWSGMLFVLARIIYVPAYISGVPGVRSLVWGVSQLGVLGVLASVLGAGAWLGVAP